MSTTFRHAGAGSGKTFSIEQDIGSRLEQGVIRPDQIMAVTFTRKAAAELQERIGAGLLGRGRPELAAALDRALIGTVDSVCGRLLETFAFELGLSPRQRVIEDRDKSLLMKEALDISLDPSETARLNALAARLGDQDWQGAVVALGEQARMNGFDESALSGFATASAGELLALLPPEDPSVDEAGLRAEMVRTLPPVQAAVKPTKKLEKSREQIEGSIRKREMTWEDWVRVSKLDAGVKEAPLLADLRAYGARVLECPGFRGDLEDYIVGVFDAARTVLVEFARLKAGRGLVDFVDQERLVLDALDHPDVKARLSADLGYLVVDEFQDTNPLQLALFARLAALADEVLFVGDAKQAIYGFRGSDPRLALDVIHHVQSGGGTLENLPDSWRSRPGLVHLVNDLFVKPFSHLLTEDQVKLTPKANPPLASAELAWWKLDGSNQEKRAAALASGLRGIVESRQEVWDKAQGQVREAQWRDLAVLCWSNDDAAKVAEACVAQGVPVSLARSGLLDTPEVTLALACLRRLADPTDSLASAEIVALERGANAGQWLGDRLDAVDSGTQRDWDDQASPMLYRLAEARGDMSALSPAEALTTAIQAADVHQIVLGWGEAARLTDHRLANLERLTRMASEYQDHCLAQRLAGTTAGFILWLRTLEQDSADEQAANPGNAVTISTYHKAKGLEWPIVVCAGLDKEPQPRIYGIRVLASSAPFDWDAPLAGRALRYWPNPFPDQKGSDPLNQRLQQTPAWAEAEQLAQNEAIQLLYVGMTRARDQLVLTEESNNPVGRWLALLDSSLFPAAGGILTLPCGNRLEVAYLALNEGGATVPAPPRPRHWLPACSAPLTSTIGYLCAPSSAPPLAGATVSVVEDFGSRITLHGSPNMEEVGMALHHCLAMTLTNPGLHVSDVKRILGQYPSVTLDAGEVEACSRSLAGWIARRHPDAKLHCELPFSRQLTTGQFQSGQIDLALELPDRWVIIDHKSNPQPRTQWCAIAAEHSGQLAAYAGALADLSGLPVGETLIHFSVSGGMVRVVV